MGQCWPASLTPQAGVSCPQPSPAPSWEVQCACLCSEGGSQWLSAWTLGHSVGRPSWDTGHQEPGVEEGEPRASSWPQGRGPGHPVGARPHPSTPGALCCLPPHTLGQALGAVPDRSALSPEPPATLPSEAGPGGWLLRGACWMGPVPSEGQPLPLVPFLLWVPQGPVCPCPQGLGGRAPLGKGGRFLGLERCGEQSPVCAGPCKAGWLSAPGCGPSGGGGVPSGVR